MQNMLESVVTLRSKDWGRKKGEEWGGEEEGGVRGGGLQ